MIAPQIFVATNGNSNTFILTFNLGTSEFKNSSHFFLSNGYITLIILRGKVHTAFIQFALNIRIKFTFGYYCLLCTTYRPSPKRTMDTLDVLSCFILLFYLLRKRYLQVSVFLNINLFVYIVAYMNKFTLNNNFQPPIRFVIDFMFIVFYLHH